MIKKIICIIGIVFSIFIAICILNAYSRTINRYKKIQREAITEVYKTQIEFDTKMDMAREMYPVQYYQNVNEISEIRYQINKVSDDVDKLVIGIDSDIKHVTNRTAILLLICITITVISFLYLHKFKNET